MSRFLDTEATVSRAGLSLDEDHSGISASSTSSDEESDKIPVTPHRRKASMLKDIRRRKRPSVPDSDGEQSASDSLLAKEVKKK